MCRQGQARQLRSALDQILEKVRLAKMAAIQRIEKEAQIGDGWWHDIENIRNSETFDEADFLRSVEFTVCACMCLHCSKARRVEAEK